jgi:hypothetical protein
MRFLPLLLLVVACRKDGGSSRFGLDERPANPTCVAPERPSTGASIALERFGPSFSSPIWLGQAPGDDDTWYVVEQRGYVRRFVEGDSAATLVLDLTDRVTAGGEMGLLAIMPPTGACTCRTRRTRTGRAAA